MNEKCVFSTSEGWCSALTETRCDGSHPGKVCSFRKTEKEYIDGINNAIRINRRKGNCSNCKYRSVQCELRETEKHHDC